MTLLIYSNKKATKQLIRKSYCKYGFDETLHLHQLAAKDLQSYINTGGWLRPAYKIPAVCKMVEQGLRTPAQYPTLDFSILRNKPKTIHAFLGLAAQDDYIFEDVQRMLSNLPTFGRLGDPTAEIKFLKTLSRIDPFLKDPINQIITEFKRL